MSVRTGVLLLVVLSGCGHTVAPPPPAPPKANAAMPNTELIDRLRTLIAVNVDREGVFVGGAPMKSADELAARVRSLQLRAFEPTVYLVRAEREVPKDRVYEAIAALQRAGAPHIVLGLGAPSETLPSWDACPFPAKADVAEVDTAAVIVRASVDARGRTAMVLVLSDDPNGFGGAAALCLARQRLTPNLASGKPFRVRFERPPP